MKNLFKFGFLALAISLSVACGDTNKTGGGADTTAVDTTMVDTAATVDTAAATVDTAAAKVDTAAAKTDTTKK